MNCEYNISFSRRPPKLAGYKITNNGLLFFLWQKIWIRDTFKSPSVLDFISLWFAKMKRSNLNIQIEKYLKSQWIDSLLIWKSTPRTLCGLYTLLVVQWWHNKLWFFGIWSLRMAIKASILTACNISFYFVWHFCHKTAFPIMEYFIHFLQQTTMQCLE